MDIGCALTELFSFTYRAELDNGLIEYEYDHVFAGRCADDPRPDVRGADAWRWLHLSLVRIDLNRRPHRYTPWFRIAFYETISNLYLELVLFSPKVILLAFVRDEQTDDAVTLVEPNGHSRHDDHRTPASVS